MSLDVLAINGNPVKSAGCYDFCGEAACKRAPQANSLFVGFDRMREGVRGKFYLWPHALRTKYRTEGEWSNYQRVPIRR